MSSEKKEVIIPRRNKEGKFPWGAILNTFKMGPYEIVQYKDNTNGDILFHGWYFDHERKVWMDTHSSTDCLEGAVVNCISSRQGYDRTSLSASHFIGKMLSLDTIAGIEYYNEE
jgi:hypothetical protein